MTSRFEHLEMVWWGIGIFLMVILFWAAYAHLGVLMLSLFIYYATRPLLKRVERVIPSPTISVFVSLALFVLPLLLIFGYAANVAVNEFYNVVVTFDAVNIKPYIEPYISNDILGVDWELLFTSPQEFFEKTSSLSLFQRGVDHALSSMGFVGSVFINLVLVFIISFYLLRDDDQISAWIQTHFGMYLPKWDTFKHEVDTDLQTIFFGNILLAIITAIIGVTVFTILSFLNPTSIPVPYPALIGLLCGIGGLIPVIGAKLVYIPIGGYMLLWGHSFGTGQKEIVFPLAFIGFSYIIVDQIPDVVIRPYVSTKRIHMGLVMVAYIVGPFLFGWYGLFLGPTLLVLGLHFAHHILPFLLEPGVQHTETGIISKYSSGLVHPETVSINPFKKDD